MKIRNGFVSNSSTTSFCIYGVMWEASEFADMMKESGLVPENVKKESNKNDGCIDDIIDWFYFDRPNFIKNEGLSVEYGYDSEYIYIGATWSKIPDDVVVGEFKKSIKQKIENIFKIKDAKCEMHEECFHD